MTIDELMRRSHETARAKGWWDTWERNFPEQLALVHSEVSEVLEAYRDDPNPFEGMRRVDYEETAAGPKPVGIASEFADILIRVGDCCARYGIPLEEAIRVKMEYNARRPHRHGGKNC